MSDKNPASSTAKCTYPIKKRPAMIVNLQSKLDLKDQTQEAAAALASLSDTCDKASSAASSTKTDPEDYHSDSEESYSSLNGVFPKVVHNPSKNKMMVDHTYTDYGVIKEDYLRFLEDGDEDLSSLSDEEKLKMQKRAQKIRNIFGDVGPSRKNSGGVVKPFPEKLMDVLEREDMESIITWMPHGRAFIVLQPQQLRDIVLPRFFKQTKFMSFTRQLNLWGFKRITKGVDSGAYYHALFLRGRPRLAMLMKRQKIKGTGIKLSPNPETEPNFYEISEKSALPPIDPSKKEKKPLPPLRQHLPSRAILDNSASMLEYEGMNRSARSANRLQTGFDRQIYPFGSSVQNGADPLSLIPGSGLNNVSGICDNFSMPLLPQQQPASSGSNDFINILQQKVFLEQQQQQQQHQMRRYGQAVSSEQLFNNPYDSLAPSRANEDLQLQELKQRLLNAARTMEPQPQQMSQRYLLQKLQQQHSSNYHSPYFPSELGLRQQHQFQQATSTGDEVAALMSTLENTRNVALATQARLEQVTRDLQHARNRRSL